MRTVMFCFTAHTVQAMERASLLKDEALELQNRDQWGDREYSILEDLKLRYFTPKEIANLLCFPDNYGFPKDLSNIQLYRCLGNSLNVHVVSVLIKLLTFDEGLSDGE
ncbi:hypothetical protein FSP39_016859 [Pinctada imbricata]|uniref:tRNA (cytosine(38)-C(5))-methyltransferase n=1 Tax=Pinctada imbricata TaxID=66713 RepID=A0AA89C6R6_PINIB|nr:hypothetical protein FSP39_016859 [Pinctada imbricata]